MSMVAENDQVKISFVGKIDNGDIFMDISPEQPLTIVIGQSELPPTVEKGVIGMKKGETKKICVSPDEGYGRRTKDLLHEVSKTAFKDNVILKPGMIISQKIEKEGTEHEIPATIIEIKGDIVTIDYNHPLAGHNLTYNLTVLDFQTP